MSTIVVLDTSYLVEIYNLPEANAAHQKEIRRRMKVAIKARTSFVVSHGVVFELGDLIAQVRDRTQRIALAQQWSKDIRLALERDPQRPFDVLPGVDVEALIDFVATWAAQLARGSAQRKDRGDIGLSDWGSVAAARSAKAHGVGARVHIWTKDAALKKHEPDTDPDPYLGHG